MELSHAQDVPLDAIDVQLCALLGKDCRTSFRELGQMLHKSPTTIKTRIENLEAQGIIKSWGASIDYEKLGFEYIGIVEIEIMRTRTKEVLLEIAQHPNVFGVYDVTGDYEALVMLRARTRNEFRDLEEKIFGSRFISRITTHILLQKYKDHVDSVQIFEQWQLELSRNG